MAFNSLSFWLVFPFIFVFYWLIPARYNTWRKLYLIVLSYLLYMNWRPAYAIVLLTITFITYLGGIVLGNRSLNATKEKRRTIIAWLFALLGLFPLLVFKYYNFINESISIGLGNIGLRFSLPGLNWAIPIGISFYSFQAVGYLLDVYHGRSNVENNLLDYFLFVSFFPQITSGPISTAKDLMPQIKSPRTFTYEQGRDGLHLLLWGMFIKMVIADRLGMFVDTVYGNYAFYSGNTCLLACVFYTIQIYCDFAGYSWMAIGVAKTLGFDLINNFRQPYLASSITEFWRRWHISLTRWLTNHVYIALGGNRCSKAKQYWNILVTFIVSGLWHGANWTYVFWGLIHGFIQIIEKALGIDPKGRYANSKILRILTPLRIILTFMIVCFAWVFFRMPTINSAFELLSKVVLERGAVNIVGVYNGAAPVLIAAVGILILVLKEFIEEFDSNNHLFVRNSLFQWVSSVVLFVLILATGVLDGSQFIYASF